MCGRFSRSRPVTDYAEYYQAEPTEPDIPSFNVCPGDDILALVTEPDQSRHLTWFHWGLVPFWSKGPDSRFSMINARAETLAEKPAYRAAYKQHRCVIVADGFYEWQKTEHGKQPFYFRFLSGEPLNLAGLWDHWEAADGSQHINSATIITTTANEVVRPVHERMPVILLPEQLDQWLDVANDNTQSLEPLLAPADEMLMEAWPVSRKVNSPMNNGPALIERINAGLF